MTTIVLFISWFLRRTSRFIPLYFVSRFIFYSFILLSVSKKKIILYFNDKSKKCLTSLVKLMIRYHIYALALMTFLFFSNAFINLWNYWVFIYLYKKLELNLILTNISILWQKNGHCLQSLCQIPTLRVCLIFHLKKQIKENRPMTRVIHSLYNIIWQNLL